MSEIVIVEYNKDYAAGVATMWNNTTEGWNGADFSTTTEKVLENESISPHFNLFLAVDKAVKGDEPKVVGYCKLTKDSKEEDALYIDGLSVIPEYFNKKVGKALMMESVKRTIELNYPKLFLYTWSGNTKAVPLYKKTGFFWESGNDIHLINLIPTVLKCEAVKKYFENADWYNDSKREIELVPDGRKENKFEYYTYIWEKDNKKLLMEFTKKGRGLRKIDCDDYSITATVCNRDLSFGKNHKITYEIINKSGKPLEIEIEGVENKDIKFNFSYKKNVETSVTVEADFFVNPIVKDINEREKHPEVCSNIKINGKSAEFITGIVPKFPLYTSDIMKKPGFNYVDQKGCMYLNCESFSDEKAVFEFDLSNGTDLEFENPLIKIELNPNEKKSIEIKYKVNKGCLFSKKTKITAKFQNGNEIEFYKTLVVRALTYKSKGFARTENQSEINIGKYTVSLMKKNHNCCTYFIDREKNDQNIYYFSPKIGMPYTDEFDLKEVDRVEHFEEKDSMSMKGYYSSLKNTDISIVVCYRLYHNGILEKWLEFTNNRQTELDENLIYCDRFALNRENLIMPYDNKIVKVQGGVDEDLSNYETKKISENWIYSGDSKKSAGMTWPKEYDLKIMNWYFAIEHSLNGIKSGETKSTKPVVFFINTFDLDNFRKFVLKQSKADAVIVSKSSELFINSQNPFVKDHITIELKDHKCKPLIADLKITSKNGSFSETNIIAKEEDKLSAMSTKVSLKTDKQIEMIGCNIRYKAQQLKITKALFSIGKQDIKLVETDVDGKKVFSVDNGIVSFKTSPEFAPNIFSLKKNGIEWVDSSFPKTYPKAWWTPWYGGLFMNLDDFSEKELLEENISAEFITVEDNFRNKWQGVKIIVKVDKNEMLKGTTFEQYYLTLPGTPIVVNFNKIINNTDHFLERSYYKLLFFKGSDEIKDLYWNYKNNDKEECSYYHGIDCKNIRVDHDEVHSLNSVKFDDKILFFHQRKVEYLAVCTNEVTIPKVVAHSFEIKNNDSYTSSNEFMIFTDKEISYRELEDLRNIKFSVT